MLATYHMLFLTSVSAKVYYVSRTMTSNSSCLHEESGICSNLTEVIEFASNKSDITIYVYHGDYTLTSSSKTVFYSSNNVIMRGQGEGGEVEVVCTEPNSGLVFVDCRNISIRSIKMSGCGKILVSTSKNFTSSQNGTPFLYFNATLYFQQCFNIFIDYVTITNSTGIAVQMYATSDFINITNSNFSYNPQQGSGLKQCGGLYIEFPYCLPGDRTCYESNSIAPVVPQLSVSNSQYRIINCTFSYNNATVDDQDSTYLFPVKTYSDVFGRGGGLSVFFKGNATNNSILLQNSNFTNNWATFGGGMQIQFEDNSGLNSVEIQNCNFLNNKVSESGGGIRLSFIAYNSNVSHNNISLLSCTFVSNTADEHVGGGVSFITTREPLALKATNRLTFTKCNWTHNVARIGAAMDLTVYHSILVGSAVNTTFSQCNFTANSVDYTSKLDQPVGMGAVYLDSVPATFVDQIVFKGNHNGSGLVMINTQVYIDNGATVTFEGNSASDGGGISLRGNAFLVLGRNATLMFCNNSATHSGGAIYSHYEGNRDLINSLNCFIQYYNILLAPADWDMNIIFENNVANKTPNAIYATTIIPCLWGQAYGPEILKTQNVFCWNNHWIYNGSSETASCTASIRTAPATLQSSDELINIMVQPGIHATMPFMAKDDEKNDVTNNLILTVRSTDADIKVDSNYDVTSTNKILLYQLSNGTDSGNITIETQGPRVLRTQLKVTFSQCNFGFELSTSGNCSEVGSFQNRLVYIHGYVFLLRSYWVGYYPTTSNKTLVVAQCAYCKYINNSLGFIRLNHTTEEVEGQLCGDHAGGLLCSVCKDDFAPSFNTEKFDCVQCDEKDKFYNWIIFLLLEIVIPLLMFLLLYITKFSLTSGILNGAIVFAQMTTTAVPLDGIGAIAYSNVFNSTRLVETLSAFRTALYQVWNLMFCQPCISPKCIAPNTTVIHVLATQYVVAFLPLLVVSIALTIYWIDYYWSACTAASCKLKEKCLCISKLFELVRGNGPTALAALVLLSYTKIAVITCFLLTWQHFVDKNGEKLPDPVLYFDASIPYFGDEHLRYAIPALLIGVPFLVIVPALLVFYRYDDPNKNGGFFNHILKEFQQEFKDGCDVHTGTSLQAVTDIRSDRVPSLIQSVNIDNEKDIQYCCHYDDKIKYALTFNTDTEFFSLNIKCCSGSCWFFTHWSLQDCRWVSGWYFIFRVVLLACYCFGPNVMFTYVLQSVFCMFGMMIILILQPYKKVSHNILDSFWLFLMAVVILLSGYQYYTTTVNAKAWGWAFWLQYILLLVPAAWITVGLFYFEARRQKTYQKIFHFFKLICCVCTCLKRMKNKKTTNLLLGETDSIKSRLITQSYSPSTHPSEEATTTYYHAHVRHTIT